MSRLLALAAFLATAAACTPVLNVSVEISVPAALQATLTYPVQVAFETDLHNGQSQSLCAAEATDVVVFLDDTVNECAAPIGVRAVLAPWTAPSTGCTETVGNPYSLISGDAVAVATATAFEDVDTSGGLCKGGDDTVTMTLEAVAP